MAVVPLTLPILARAVAMTAPRSWTGVTEGAKTPRKDLYLIDSQSGRPKAKLLKFKWEWLRACNDWGARVHPKSNLPDGGLQRSRETSGDEGVAAGERSAHLRATGIGSNLGYRAPVREPAERIAMANDVKIEFARIRRPSRGVLVVFCDDALKLGAATRRLLGKAAETLARAAAAERFSGKSGTVLDIVLPAELQVARLSIIGAGKTAEIKSKDLLKLGGVAAGRAPAAGGDVTIVAELPDGAMRPEAVADLATGARLRAYVFDRYKTKRKDGEDKRRTLNLAIAVANPAAAATGLGRAAMALRRGRHARARPHQRAAERAVSRRIRATRREPFASSASRWTSSMRRR